MQWNASFSEQIFCYTNNVHNKDGGTHLTGLRAGLTKVFNQYGTVAFAPYGPGLGPVPYPGVKIE